MPLGGAHVGHRLDRLVLGRQRGGQRLGERPGGEEPIGDRPIARRSSADRSSPLLPVRVGIETKVSRSSRSAFAERTYPEVLRSSAAGAQRSLRWGWSPRRRTPPSVVGRAWSQARERTQAVPGPGYPRPGSGGGVGGSVPRGGAHPLIPGGRVHSPRRAGSARPRAVPARGGPDCSSPRGGSPGRSCGRGPSRPAPVRGAGSTAPRPPEWSGRRTPVGRRRDPGRRDHRCTASNRRMLRSRTAAVPA